MYQERVARLYLPLTKIIVRHWAGRLKPSEFLCLLFILERTYRFGKTEELITYRQMSKGIHMKDGTEIHSGMGIGMTAVRGGVAGLKDKGLISYRPETRGKWHGAVVSIDAETIGAAAEDFDLGIPKRRVRTRRAKNEKK